MDHVTHSPPTPWTMPPTPLLLHGPCHPPPFYPEDHVIHPPPTSCTMSPTPSYTVDHVTHPPPTPWTMSPTPSYPVDHVTHPPPTLQTMSPTPLLPHGPCHPPSSYPADHVTHPLLHFEVRALGEDGQQRDHHAEAVGDGRRVVRRLRHQDDAREQLEGVVQEDGLYVGGQLGGRPLQQGGQNGTRGTEVSVTETAVDTT